MLPLLVWTGVLALTEHDKSEDSHVYENTVYWSLWNDQVQRTINRQNECSSTVSATVTIFLPVVEQRTWVFSSHHWLVFTAQIFLTNSVLWSQKCFPTSKNVRVFFNSINALLKRLSFYFYQLRSCHLSNIRKYKSDIFQKDPTLWFIMGILYFENDSILNWIESLISSCYHQWNTAAEKRQSNPNNRVNSCNIRRVEKDR